MNKIASLGISALTILAFGTSCGPAKRSYNVGDNILIDDYIYSLSDIYADYSKTSKNFVIKINITTTDTFTYIDYLVDLDINDIEVKDFKYTLNTECTIFLNDGVDITPQDYTVPANTKFTGYYCFDLYRSVQADIYGWLGLGTGNIILIKNSDIKSLNFPTE